MAGRGYTVAIASDTKAFKQGVEVGIIKPVEDARNELDDLGKSRGPQQLEDDLKAAQRASDNLKDETKRTADTIAREYREAYKSAGNAAEGFERDAGENVKGFKEEAVQNFSEVASSFNGDMSQMSDGVQGLTGGLASSLTPGVGIPVAILGAAAAFFLAEWQKSNEAIKQISADTFDQIASDGIGAFDSMEAASARLKGVYADHEDEVNKIAKTLGILPETVAQAWAGQADAIAVVKQATSDWGDANADAFKKGGSLASDAARDFEHLRQPMEDAWKGYDTGKQKSERYFSSLSSDLLRAVSQVQDVGVEVDDLGNKVVHLPQGDVYIDAHTGQASLDISKFKGDYDQKVDQMNGRDILVSIGADTSNFDAAVRRIKQTNIRINGQIVYQTPGGSKLY